MIPPSTHSLNTNLSAPPESQQPILTDRICAICQECLVQRPFIPRHPLDILHATHLFHRECINPWLNRSQTHTCPTCRAEFPQHTLHQTYSRGAQLVHTTPSYKQLQQSLSQGILDLDRSKLILAYLSPLHAEYKQSIQLLIQNGPILDETLGHALYELARQPVPDVKLFTMLGTYGPLLPRWERRILQIPHLETRAPDIFHLVKQPNSSFPSLQETDVGAACCLILNTPWTTPSLQEKRLTHLPLEKLQSGTSAVQALFEAARRGILWMRLVPHFSTLYTTHDQHEALKIAAQNGHARFVQELSKTLSTLNDHEERQEAFLHALKWAIRHHYQHTIDALAQHHSFTSREASLYIQGTLRRAAHLDPSIVQSLCTLYRGTEPLPFIALITTSLAPSRTRLVLFLIEHYAHTYTRSPRSPLLPTPQAFRIGIQHHPAAVIFFKGVGSQGFMPLKALYAALLAQPAALYAIEALTAHPDCEKLLASLHTTNVSNWTAPLLLKQISQQELSQWLIDAWHDQDYPMVFELLESGRCTILSDPKWNTLRDCLGFHSLNHQDRWDPYAMLETAISSCDSRWNKLAIALFQRTSLSDQNVCTLLELACEKGREQLIISFLQETRISCTALETILLRAIYNPLTPASFVMHLLRSERLSQATLDEGLNHAIQNGNLQKIQIFGCILSPRFILERLICQYQTELAMQLYPYFPLMSPEEITQLITFIQGIRQCTLAWLPPHEDAHPAIPSLDRFEEQLQQHLQQMRKAALPA